MEKFLNRSSSIPNLVSKRPREDEAASEQWQQPKRFVVSPKRIPNEKNVPNTNRFKDLPLDEPSLDSYQQATKKKVNNHIPPIVIELQGSWTHQKIKDSIKKYEGECHLQYRGKNSVRVHCYSTKIHQLVKENLQENASFHTFTRKDEKLPKAVIKGLPKFLHDTLPTELDSLGFTGCTTTEMKTLHRSECPPVLVQLPSGTDMTKFKKIKYLSHCVVEIQKYTPSKKMVTQCFRCQGFGHASRNCNRSARCVKCALPHANVLKKIENNQLAAAIAN